MLYLLKTINFRDILSIAFLISVEDIIDKSLAMEISSKVNELFNNTIH